MTSSKGFLHHFNIISNFLLSWLLNEKESSFCTYLFCSTEMTWMFIISTAIWVNGWDTSSVASRARSELTSLQCNWNGNQKGKGTDEPPNIIFIFSSFTLPSYIFLNPHWRHQLVFFLFLSRNYCVFPLVFTVSIWPSIWCLYDNCYNYLYHGHVLTAVKYFLHKKTEVISFIVEKLEMVKNNQWRHNSNKSEILGQCGSQKICSSRT